MPPRSRFVCVVRTVTAPRRRRSLGSCWGWPSASGVRSTASRPGPRSPLAERGRPRARGDPRPAVAPPEDGAGEFAGDLGDAAVGVAPGAPRGAGVVLGATPHRPAAVPAVLDEGALRQPATALARARRVQRRAEHEQDQHPAATSRTARVRPCPPELPTVVSVFTSLSFRRLPYRAVLPPWALAHHTTGRGTGHRRNCRFGLGRRELFGREPRHSCRAGRRLGLSVGASAFM